MASHCIQCRVSAETKAQLAILAHKQSLTESALLRRLVELTLQTAGLGHDTLLNQDRHAKRPARLMIRLLPDDQLLLRERATARGMPAATYVSVLVRAHLRTLTPLPTAELAALNRSIAELGAIGRNLNQLVRAVNQGSHVSGPSKEDLRALLLACKGLRDYVAGLMDRNAVSWESGHD